MKWPAVNLPLWSRILLGAWVLLVFIPAPSRSEEDLWGGRRTFAAKLSADNQTKMTDSDGIGTVSMVFDIASKTATWEISFNNLTSPPTAIHLHGPAQAGTNAAPLIDLGGAATRRVDRHPACSLVGKKHAGSQATAFESYGNICRRVSRLEYCTSIAALRTDPLELV
jgi:hypothetical protein